MHEHRALLRQRRVIGLCVPVYPAVVPTDIYNDEEYLNDRRNAVGRLNENEIVRDEQKYKAQEIRDDESDRLQRRKDVFLALDLEKGIILAAPEEENYAGNAVEQYHRKDGKVVETRAHDERIADGKQQCQCRIYHARAQIEAPSRCENGVYSVGIADRDRMIERILRRQADPRLEQREIGKNILYRAVKAVYIRAEVDKIKSRQDKAEYYLYRLIGEV